MDKLLLSSVGVACAAVLFCSCSKDEEGGVSVPEFRAGQLITDEVLRGNIKGTMLAGKTYYFDTELTINPGDTVVMQSGVTLISRWRQPTAEAQVSPQITVNGTFISLGTKENPNVITCEADLRKPENRWKGYWGGLQCGYQLLSGTSTTIPCGDVVLKWTTLEYIGGQNPYDNVFEYKNGDPRYAILFCGYDKPEGSAAKLSNLIVEDCIIRNTIDDAVRVCGGNISFMRNVWEFQGSLGGEGINIKSGTKGDIAYNLFMGCATNGPKVSGSGGLDIYDVNVFNNTMVNCGYRRDLAGRGGSMNIEANGRGRWYNNLIVNCRFGFRLVGLEGQDAQNSPDKAVGLYDKVNTHYGNNLYYGYHDEMRTSTRGGVTFDERYAESVGGTGKTHQEEAGKTPIYNVIDVDPQFVSYDVAKFTSYTAYYPNEGSAQSVDMNSVGSYNFRLKSTSPAIGKGNTSASIALRATTTTGELVAIVTPPGKDIGCYQADGTGNQRY